MPPLKRRELRAFLQHAHLLNGDLAERPFRTECNEIGVGLKEKRIVTSLVGWHLFTFGQEFDVVRKAKIVLLNGLAVAEQTGAEAAGKRSLPNAVRSRQKDGLGNSVAADHLVQHFSSRGIAVEVLKHAAGPSLKRELRDALGPHPKCRHEPCRLAVRH